jgi:S-ribosylhomocysteine lyase LuxS involved in autoinducer biosynthesis
MRTPAVVQPSHDALLAQEVRTAEHLLNTAIKNAVVGGLHVHLKVVDVSTIGLGHHEIVHAQVMRKL